MQLYEAMVKEERDAPNMKAYRLSLRRVLHRFCSDSSCYPTSLFRKDVVLPKNTEVYYSAWLADIYRIQDSQDVWVALKTYRVFENKNGRRDFSRVSSIIYHQYKTPRL